MVIMGEKLDEEELALLLKEFDEDGSGVLNFREFCLMMKGGSSVGVRVLACVYCARVGVCAPHYD